MRLGKILVPLCVLAASAGLVPAGFAGQVHVDVGPDFSMLFSPRAVNVNAGDHVVWVWRSGNHSVTSGDSSTITGNGLFDSGLIAYNSTAGTTFSWRSASPTTVLYYCSLHAPDMAGRVIVGASGIPVASFRLTEVQYNVAGGLDLIEIANLGNAVGDLGRYRVVANSTVYTLPRDTLSVGAGRRIVVHCNTTGTNTQTDFFTTALPDLPTTGSISLYVPNTAPGHAALSDATQMIDFMEYGTGGQANESVAATDAFWAAGTFIPPVADGHSMELCSASPRGVSSWAEIAVPNFGSDGNCSTPALTTTWGRVKSLYR